MMENNPNVLKPPTSHGIGNTLDTDTDAAQQSRSWVLILCLLQVTHQRCDGTDLDSTTKAANPHKDSELQATSIFTGFHSIFWACYFRMTHPVVAGFLPAPQCKLNGVNPVLGLWPFGIVVYPVLSGISQP
jgi:hypothetical protein